METESVLARFVAEAIQVGADEIEVDYKDGHEHVFAMRNQTGVGVGRLPSSSPDAKLLRRELQNLTKRKVAITIGDARIELRGTTFDSFGETAFRVKLRRV